MKLNEKDKDPFLEAISKNNIEIVKLLIEYATQHQIVLEYNKKNIGKNTEIKKILQNYEIEKKLKEKVIKIKRLIFY